MPRHTKKLKPKLAQLCDNEPAQFANKLRRHPGATAFLPRKPHLGIPISMFFFLFEAALFSLCAAKMAPTNRSSTKFSLSSTHLLYNQPSEYGAPAVGAHFHTTERKKKKKKKRGFSCMSPVLRRKACRS